jgi:voltage-gated potassium channel
MTRRLIHLLHLDQISSAFHNPVRNFQLSMLVLVLLVGFGTGVYMWLENMVLTDALYMTIITITTVGFGEVQPLSSAGRLFTVILILLGVSAATTAISNGLGIILGPRLWQSIRQRKLERLLMTIENHYIVCGYGRMGQQVVEDLHARHEPFVVIDTDPNIEVEMLELQVPYIVGDATRDETLLEAGIERARGLVAALSSDPDNVMTVLTARELNRKLIIVARVSNAEAESKLRRAGANRVISPYQLGGHRIALALIRPSVSDFLDRIYSFGVGIHVDLGQLHVREGSRLAGQQVGTSDLRKLHNVNILAIQKPNGEITITPDPKQELETGAVLIVIGPPENIYRLEKEYETHN